MSTESINISFPETRIYAGKLTHEPYAVNENFVLAFPEGLHEKAPVWVFSTWTKHDDGTEKKPFIQVKGIAYIDKNRFYVKSDDYYALDGVFAEDATDDAILVTVKGGRGNVKEFNVYPVTSN